MGRQNKDFYYIVNGDTFTRCNVVAQDSTATALLALLISSRTWRTLQGRHVKAIWLLRRRLVSPLLINHANITALSPPMKARAFTVPTSNQSRLRKEFPKQAQQSPSNLSRKPNAASNSGPKNGNWKLFCGSTWHDKHLVGLQGPKDERMPCLFCRDTLLCLERPQPGHRVGHGKVTKKPHTAWLTFKFFGLVQLSSVWFSLVSGSLVAV